MVVHNCNSSTQKAEAVKSQVLGLPGLKRKMVPQKKQKKTENTKGNNC